MQQSQPQLATDPNLAAEQQQAQNTQIAALQQEAQGDTASLMARYGTRLALSGTGIAAPTPASMAAAPGPAPGRAP